MSNEKWHEPMSFEIEIIKVTSACRVNHKVGETFKAKYRTPDRSICGEAYVGMYPILYAMRINGDMRYLGKEKKFETTYFCPSRVVQFIIRGFPNCNNCGKNVSEFNELTPFTTKYTQYVCEECLDKLTS